MSKRLMSQLVSGLMSLVPAPNPRKKSNGRVSAQPQNDKTRKVQTMSKIKSTKQFKEQVDALSALGTAGLGSLVSGLPLSLHPTFTPPGIAIIITSTQNEDASGGDNNAPTQVNPVTTTAGK